MELNKNIIEDWLKVNGNPEIDKQVEMEAENIKKQYVFTKTSSGDRTNIMTSFPLWDIEMFIEDVKKVPNRDRYRYGPIGGRMNLVKDMMLVEFDSLFDSSTFTSEEITRVFRKEVSLKYGEHKIKETLKYLSSKEILKGNSYKDHNGAQWFFLGNVKRVEKEDVYRNPRIREEEGFGYIRSVRNISNITRDVEILKSKKRFISKCEEQFDFDSEYTHTTTPGYYNRTVYLTTLTLL